MALDESLWQIARVPCIRLYEWDHPAISFGYFGKYQDVRPYETEHELVRRCTGGGIVFHGADLTYALVVPTNALPKKMDPIAIYSFVHEAIIKTLAEDGFSATLAADEQCRASLSDAMLPSPSRRDGLQLPAGEATRGHPTNVCFASPVRADVLVDNRKVAGAAQRRSRQGLLQQGSIQSISLPAEFKTRFVKALCPKNVVRRLDDELVERATLLAQEKYASDSWLKRR